MNVQFKKRLRTEYIDELERAQAEKDYKSMSEIYTEIEALDGLDKHHIDQFFVEYTGDNTVWLPRECLKFFKIAPGMEVVCQIFSDSTFAIEPYDYHLSADEYKFCGCKQAYIRKITDGGELIFDDNFEQYLKIKPGSLLIFKLFDDEISVQIYKPLLV